MSRKQRKQQQRIQQAANCTLFVLGSVALIAWAYAYSLQITSL